MYSQNLLKVYPRQKHRLRHLSILKAFDSIEISKARVTRSCHRIRDRTSAEWILYITFDFMLRHLKRCTKKQLQIDAGK